MTINRRKFTQLAVLGGASLITTSSTSGIFFPKPAEAFIFGLLLRSLSSRAVFGGLLRFTAGRLARGLFGPTQEEMLAIQLADRDFVERRFSDNRTEIARTQTNVFWGQQRQDRLGPNIGFGFVQKYQDTVSTAKITGPTMVGINAATQILSQQGLSPREIADSLLPSYSQYDDWCSWEGDTFPNAQTNRSTCFTSYRTAFGEVTSRYDLIQPGAGGRGNVSLIIEAGGQPRRDITVEVTFS